MKNWKNWPRDVVRKASKEEHFSPCNIFPIGHGGDLARIFKKYVIIKFLIILMSDGKSTLFDLYTNPNLF